MSQVIINNKNARMDARMRDKIRGISADTARPNAGHKLFMLRDAADQGFKVIGPESQSRNRRAPELQKNLSPETTKVRTANQKEKHTQANNP